MAKVHGINGLIYWGGNELSEANAWSLTFDLDVAEVPDFGDSWMDHVRGIMTWTGSIDAWYDDTNDNIWNAATASGWQQLVVYPDRNTLTRYWYGDAFGSFSIDVSAGDAVSISVDITGTGPLTRVAS